MPLLRMRSEVYGSVSVCRLLQLLRDQCSAGKSFYRHLDMFSWIEICRFKIMLRSRVIAGLLTWKAIVRLHSTISSNEASLHESDRHSAK